MNSDTGLGGARRHPIQGAGNEHNASIPGSRHLFPRLDYSHTTPSQGHRSMNPVTHGLPLPTFSAPLTQDNLIRHDPSLRVKVERKHDDKPFARQYAHINKVKRINEKKHFGRGHNRVTKKEQKERKALGHRRNSTKKEEKMEEKPVKMEDLEEGEIYEGPSGLRDTDGPSQRPITNKPKLEPQLKYDDDEVFKMAKIPCYKGIPGLGNYIKEE